MPVLRPHDLPAFIFAAWVTLSYGLEFGVLVAVLIWAAEELDNFI